MTAQRWEKIKEVFDSVLDQAPQEQASFVERACLGDEDLQQEVMRMLHELEKAEETETCLDQPIACLSQLLPRGELIAGRYRVLQLLGRGGMGEVYEVRDELLSENVALKTLRADLCTTESILRRFQIEIQLARKVTHPNVCRLFEVGVHEFREPGSPRLHFFTMQLLRGETLAARIRQSGPVPRSQAFPLIVQMCEGLGAAHSVGIVHRDFKSSNVMVTENRAVITDFGLAGLEAGHAAVAGGGSVSIGAKLAGTVPYMSPEQLSGGPVTAASDIYSLGVVLFEMATGQLPFDDRHIIQSAMQRVRAQPPSVRALVPHIDPRWEAAIRRCLQVEPARRFPSAGEVAAVFQEDRWHMPRLYWTRRQYVMASAGVALPLAAGANWWVWARRPYQPKPQALAWREKGLQAFRAQTYEAARRNLEQAVAIDPRYALAYADLAAVFGALDASERAKEAMLQAVSIAQDERLSDRDRLRIKALESVIASDYPRAQTLFDQLLALASDGEKPGAYIDLAWLALKRENNLGLIDSLEKALQLDPANAGAKMRLAVAVDRQGKKQEAQKLFEEAQALFHTASDYDGEIETMLQRGISLARANRGPEAVSLIEQGLRVAAGTGDVNHAVRLQLALALAYRNTGEINRSREVAEEAVKAAVDSRMDGVAAIGLLDLGNAYSLRGEPDAAERYFQQGLEFATRGRALFSQARAQLSLGALYVQYGRSAEALKYIQPALAFFRASSDLRESMQALLISGGAQETLGQFPQAEQTLREATRLAEQIHDAQVGLAHDSLSSVLAEAGRWPESLREENLALAVFRESRSAYNTAYALVGRGRLLAQMGRFPEASADFAETRTEVERMEGKQAQLRARLALGEAEISRYQEHWPESLRLAQQAANFKGGTGENIEAGILAGIAMINMGSVAAGIAACQSAIRASEEKSQPFLQAEGELALAEALWRQKRGADPELFAKSALAFFEPLQVWESVWRCYAVLGGAKPSPEASSALDRLRRLWPAEAVRTYLERPDLKVFVLP